jgi:hypothetical protein
MQLQVPMAVLYATTRSLTVVHLRPKEIKKQQWRKHIEEISRHLDTEPIQSEELSFEQQEWLEFRMARPFPKPYRPYKPIVIPYKWQEDPRT